MIKEAQNPGWRQLALIDGLLLAVALSSLTDLRLFPHGPLETAALATVAFCAIVASAVTEWKMLME